LLDKPIVGRPITFEAGLPRAIEGTAVVPLPVAIVALLWAHPYSIAADRIAQEHPRGQRELAVPSELDFATKAAVAGLNVAVIAHFDPCPDPVAAFWLTHVANVHRYSAAIPFFNRALA
jgi:hypothetical protein